MSDYFKLKIINYDKLTGNLVAKVIDTAKCITANQMRSQQTSDRILCSYL